MARSEISDRAVRELGVHLALQAARGAECCSAARLQLCPVELHSSLICSVCISIPPGMMKPKSVPKALPELCFSCLPL